MDTLGSRLRAARERKKLKQTQVMERTKIHNKTLSGYENGVSEPDADTLLILANLYEVTIDWLLGNEAKSRIINDRAKNDVMDAYDRLPLEEKQIIDDMIKALKKRREE